jgi:hypothetical protein
MLVTIGDEDGGTSYDGTAALSAIDPCPNAQPTRQWLAMRHPDTRDVPIFPRQEMNKASSAVQGTALLVLREVFLSLLPRL